MQCRDVEEVLVEEGLAPLPEVARLHVAGCPHCQGYIADLETIVSAAHALPAEVEPPLRVWIALRAQLEGEGIIKESVAAAKQEPAWWDGFGQFFRSRALATVTVGAVIAAAAILQVRQSAEPSLGPPLVPPEIVATVKELNEQEVDVRNMHLASTSPVDAALEQNLQEVDDFIADCERHLKQAPQDDLAREYLYSAYEQKAELLGEMMDRGRSVN
ncbi:MAG: hypothetical protein DMG40_21740 [Acidobacteria bacterium]|nr:MAG: hypothetical protein DMG40_21740 [Acidobacteriota bacterium]